MTHLHRVTKQSILKLVSSNFIERHKLSLWPKIIVFSLAKNTRFYCRESVVQVGNLNSLGEGQKGIRKTARRNIIKGAQAALLDYLHVTRNMPFVDAENMSLNSPHFLAKLLQKVDNGGDIGWSLTRFLWYHPINEFELFFESVGLKPCEFAPLLPRDLMFLRDDELLLENYMVLCNYGVPRSRIGRFFVEAMEIFRYDYGVLILKLEAYEKLGLSRSFVCKVVACSPYLLISDVNVDFMKVVEILQEEGIDLGWIEGHLSENSYNWSQILALLNLFRRKLYSEVQLGSLIHRHPGILLEGSGKKTLCLIVFLLKFGSSSNQIGSMFLRFPCMQVGEFFDNLRQCFLILTEIEMEADEIRKLIRSHLLLLGSYKLKGTNSLLAQLNVGKKRLCKLILENPQQMKRWAMGSRVERLPNSWKDSKLLKTRFLLNVGLFDNPDETEEAVKLFRGRGTEIQERFDCIVEAGLEKKDVAEMIRISPQILNQKKEVLQKKISFLVNDLGYPVSYLLNFPSYLNYTIKRIKLRREMWNWLKEQGITDSELSLSTLTASSENLFVKNYVKRHPRGLEMWQNLKNEIYY